VARAMFLKLLVVLTVVISVPNTVLKRSEKKSPLNRLKGRQIRKLKKGASSSGKIKNRSLFINPST
jgi:hypothetical protein